LKLVEVLDHDSFDAICSKGVSTELTREEILNLGMNILEQFKISILLILVHADTLEHAADKDEEASALVDLFKRTSVKFLATSREPLGWPEEEHIHLNGLMDLDIDSGRQLFVQSLTTIARNSLAEKMKGYTEADTQRLLYDLVTILDGHPQSLMLLGRAASQSQYSTKSLEDIIYEDYDTLISKEDLKDKSLKEHFRWKIEALETRQRLFIYLCSLINGLITIETLAFASHFIDYVGGTDTEEVRSFEDDFIKSSVETTGSRTESINKYLKNLEENSSLSGLFRKKGENGREYNIHVGFREALRQHNIELGIRLRLPKTELTEELYDEAFVVGIPSEQGM